MKTLGRWLVLLVLAALSLQLFFLARIALMAVWDPQSTSFQRSEIWRIATHEDRWRWQQQWVPYDALSDSLKRAVIASEDSGFMDHEGVEWEAIEQAWERNAKAQEAAAQREAAHKPTRAMRIRGGSTITQQLAKNLLLSSEKLMLRKAQELVLAKMLELMLSKQRILEIYLNNVEWGTGVFGAEAAAQHYFRKPAAQLSALEAARLAVMLPRPRYYETRLQSRYLQRHASVIAARMRQVTPPADAR